jgi:hypothetical protein
MSNYWGDVYVVNEQDYRETVVRQFWGRAAIGVLDLNGSRTLLLLQMKTSSLRIEMH